MAIFSGFLRCCSTALALFVLIGSAVMAPTANSRELCKNIVATGNPEYPPYLWRDPDDENKLIGANADFMQALANIAKLQKKQRTMNVSLQIPNVLCV